MTTKTVRTRHKVLALAASVALGAGSIAVGAAPVSAATGDITSFDVGPGAKPVDIVTAPDGTVWSANEGANSISRVTTDGQITSYPVPGIGPNSLTFGPDGAVWFTYSGTAAVGRMDTSGAARNFPTGAPDRIGTDIATGPDGAVWFTLPVQRLLGRVTMSGNLNFYTGAGDAVSLTPGPGRSPGMYVGAGVDGIREVSGRGSTSIPVPRNARGVGAIQNVGGTIWFGMNDAQQQPKLVRLSMGDFLEVSAQQITSVNHLSAGADDSVFVTDRSAGRVVHVTKAGVVAASFAAGSDANASTMASDGTVWVAAGSTNSQGQIRRILSGVVPQSINPPYLTPASGLASGTTVLANSGDWRYEPSSFTYEWQTCVSRSAATCSDVSGATNSSYVVTGADVGKYLRVGVSASNVNGPSGAVYSSFAATDGAAGGNAPGLATVASIGGDHTMQLRAPKKQKRSQRKYYTVTFSAEDTEGTVTFEFRKGSRSTTKTVAITDDEASFRWKPPRSWRKGSTTVTATFQPSPGESELTSAVVGSRVRIR